MSEFDDIRAGLEDALQYAQGQPDSDREHRVEVPVVDVQALRARLAMSQAEFADAFGVSVATIRNWEQGRRIPRGPARVLLSVIEQEPEAVRRVLDRLVA
jgi:putative transcriptional regulator